MCTGNKYSCTSVPCNMGGRGGEGRGGGGGNNTSILRREVHPIFFPPFFLKSLRELF